MRGIGSEERDSEKHGLVTPECTRQRATDHRTSTQQTPHLGSNVRHRRGRQATERPVYEWWLVFVGSLCVVDGQHQTQTEHRQHQRPAEIGSSLHDATERIEAVGAQDLIVRDPPHPVHPTPP